LGLLGRTRHSGKSKPDAPSCFIICLRSLRLPANPFTASRLATSRSSERTTAAVGIFLHSIEQMEERLPSTSAPAARSCVRSMPDARESQALKAPSGCLRKRTGMSLMAAKKRTKRETTSAKASPTTIRKIRPGFLSHTELASEDPTATKEWCEEVLGWKFGDPMLTPQGPYYLVNFGNNTAGGIRVNSPPESPGTVPYAEVPDIKAAYALALKAGASAMLPPDKIPGGNRWIAIVQAPGGVPIGLWAPK